jgi:hypothetical protein
MNKNLNFFKSYFLYDLFTFKNISKIISIFIFGFFFRVCIGCYSDLNIFTNYLHIVLIIYYYFTIVFTIAIDELFSSFYIKIIPNYSCNDNLNNSRTHYLGKNHNLLRQSVNNKFVDNKYEKLNLYNRFRCKIYWFFVESRKDSYVNYNEYKQF